MKYRLCSFLLIVFVYSILGSHIAYASSTYYIDSINGDNTWDGLSETFSAPNHGPWKNSSKINFGPDFVGDDQILFKRGGIYSRIITTNNFKSTDGHPIIFGAYGSGEKPIVTIASNVVATWTDLGDGRYSAPASTVEVVLEDWHDLRRGSGATSLSAGEFYFDSGTGTLYYKPSSGTPASHEVRYGNAAGFSFYQKADNFIIQDLHFIGGGFWHGANDVTPFGNIIIRRNDFTSNATIWVTATVNVPAFNFVVEDNLFKNNRVNIYFVAQNQGTWDGVVVRGNKFIDTDIKWDGTRYSAWSPGDIDAISVQNVKNSIFEKNEISGGCFTGGITIWFSLGFQGTGNIVRYNYIHDIDTYGIGFGGEENGTANVQIYGNIIANVAKSSPPYGTYWGGIRINREQTASSPSRVYDNVIYNADASYYLYTKSDNFILNNNISVNPRSGQHIRVNFGLLHNIFDNNLYSASSNIFNISYKDLSFAEWKTASGQESSSMVADPKFVSGNPTDASGFALQSGSPAISAGKNVGLSIDYAGTAVPRGQGPEIGAFEFTGVETASQSDPTPTPTPAVNPPVVNQPAVNPPVVVAPVVTPTATPSVNTNPTPVVVQPGTQSISTPPPASQNNVATPTPANNIKSNNSNSGNTNIVYIPPSTGKLTTGKTTTTTYKPTTKIVAKTNTDVPLLATTSSLEIDITLPKIPSWLDILKDIILQIATQIKRGVVRTAEVVSGIF